MSEGFFQFAKGRRSAAVARWTRLRAQAVDQNKFSQAYWVVWQENGTQSGGKRPAQPAFEVVNTGSKKCERAVLRFKRYPVSL